MIADDNTGTLTKYQNGPGIDNKLRAQTGSDTKYFLADHLGSTNGLTDSTGTLTSQTAYDSFGNQTGTLATRYAFTGRERDDVTGLMYYRARNYDPNLGRFVSEDPIGFAGGDINLYGYVKNKPVSFFDPFGLDEYSMMERLGNREPSNRTLSEMWDDLQMQLGILGMVPVIGEPFDAADGVVSLARGDYEGAALSGAALAPYFGWGAGITKACKRADSLNQLRRPYIRKSTREAVVDAAPRGPNGEWIDFNTRELFTEKPHLGHAYGKEFWRLRDQAMKDGLTQKQFNDLLNDSSLYQIERPVNNWSHRFEMPR